MKHLNKIILYIIVIVLNFIFWYSIMSFINNDINSINWSETSRFLVALEFIFSLILSIGVIQTLKDVG